MHRCLLWAIVKLVMVILQRTYVKAILPPWKTPVLEEGARPKATVRNYLGAISLAVLGQPKVLKHHANITQVITTVMENTGRMLLCATFLKYLHMLT